MNIGIVAYINPSEFKEYFDDSVKLPNINRWASAVNTIVLGFLKAGENITVISSYPFEGPTQHIIGKNISFHLVSTHSRIPKAYVIEKYYMINRLRKELSLHINSLDVIHTHWTYEFAMACSYFTNIKPIFCTIRDWAPIIRRYEKGHRKLMWYLIQERIFKKVLSNKSFYFIANSRYIYELMKKKYPQNKCYTIENPIKKDFIRLDRTSYPRTPILVSICQDLLDQRKNNTRLLKAFKLYLKTNKEAKLYLVGAYNKNHKTYKYWVANDLLKNVILLGFKDHDQIINLLDTASILVHPSLEESFGNTLLEGMARRIPVIGGKESGAVPYVLGLGKYGYLADVTDINNIVATIKKASNEVNNEEIINNATAYLLNNLNEEVISLRHITLFKEVLHYYKK